MSFEDVKKLGEGALGASGNREYEIAGGGLELQDMATGEAIAAQLKEIGEKLTTEPNWSELEPETENLIRTNSFAFLVAVAFDRGMPWQQAWRIPAEIERNGCLDPKRLASMSDAELVELLKSLPIRPRWGVKQGAKTLSDAARLVWEQFDGDAAAIWTSSSPAEVEKTLQGIHGLGAGIASMATRILHDEFECFQGQEHQIDVKPDSLLLRVFKRTGLIEEESEKQARQVARKLNREFPGALDRPAWRIGQVWCRPKQPKCTCCPLTTVCAKHI